MASATRATQDSRDVRFFKSHVKACPPMPEKQTDTAWVRVSENGDSLFHAVAAGILDSLISGQRIHSDTLQKLLKQQLTYFPAQRPRLNGLVTANERLEHLLKNPGSSELVQTMSYTLRQMTVEELCSHPESYPLAFLDITPKKMRQPETRLHESAIFALARALLCTIDVHVVAPGKPLPLQYHYNSDATHFKIVLQRQDNVFMPRVKNSSLHRLNLPDSKRLSRVEQTDCSDLTVSEIKARVEREIDRIFTRYRAIVHKLTVMRDAHELTSDQLFHLYLASVVTSAPSESIHYAGTEFGVEAFFTAIHKARTGAEPISFDSELTMSQQLIHAVGQALSVSHVSLENLFEIADNPDMEPEAVNKPLAVAAK